jgi:hypothetical protein
MQPGKHELKQRLTILFINGDVAARLPRFLMDAVTIWIFRELCECRLLELPRMNVIRSR